MHSATDHSTAVGTATGTVLTFAVYVGHEDIIKTIILSAIGAAVSFAVSMALKWVVKRFKKNG